MDTSWKIIFQYQLNSQVDAQMIYDEIFKSALTYKFHSVTNFAVPINNKVLTEAIFNLNDHDNLKLGNRIINGKKIKELFVTAIFLRFLESKFPKSSFFFVVLPEKEGPVDTAVMVTKPDVPPMEVGRTQLKLPKEHFPFLFQIKEYVDFKRLQSDSLLLIKPIDITKLNKIAGAYDESILIFMRDFMQYSSDDLKQFFAEHPNCYLIAIPDQSQITFVPENSTDGLPQIVKFNSNKHNYIITSPGQTFAVVSFNRPRFLSEKPF